MASRKESISGTGVFYQAMPAVGVDGRNIMKLIPVKMVNGHHVLSQATHSQGGNKAPQLPMTLNFNPTPNLTGQKVHLGSSAAGQFVITPSPSGSWKPGDVPTRHQAVSSLDKRPSPTSSKITPQVMSNLTPQVMSSVNPKVNSNVTSWTRPVLGGETPCNQSLPQLPVTVKSPVLPNGQYLQIPSNAQVQTLPASALPAAIKKQIFTGDQCASNSNLPNVLYVSPVTTVRQSGAPHGSGTGSGTGPLAGKGPGTPTGPAPSLKRLSRGGGPSARARPHSPIKWVIEEEAGSPGPCLVPVHPTSTARGLLKALPPKAGTPAERSSTGAEQGEDNALVMYNGKVYFVSRKLKLSPKSQVDPVISGSPCVKPPLPSVTAPDWKQSLAPVLPDEVIDLCDDDPLCPVATTAAPRSSPGQSEEDNVIFVSYVPPASASGPEEESGKIADENSKTVDHRGDGLSDQRMDASWGATHSLAVAVETTKDGDTVEHKACCSVSQETLSIENVSTVQVKETSPVPQVHKEGSLPETAINRHDNNGRTVDSREQCGATRQTGEEELHTVGGSAAPDIPSHSGGGVDGEDVGRAKESRLDAIDENRTSVSCFVFPQSSDRQLKKMFGITSDIKICLMKVDKAKPVPVVSPHIKSSTQHTLEGIHRLIQRANIKLKKRALSKISPTKTEEDFQCNLKKRKLSESESAADSCAVTNPQPDTRPQEDTKSLGSPSSFPEIIQDYEEPVNEDVLSSPGENQSLDSQPPPPASPRVLGPCCVVSGQRRLEPRRRGRPRKCTACPCGTPYIVTKPAHVKQKGHRSPRNSAESMTTAFLEKEGAPVSDKGESTGIRSPSATVQLGRHSEVTGDVPVRENLRSAPVDADEILCLERIERLKELLKEKESALEMIRKNLN